MAQKRRSKTARVRRIIPATKRNPVLELEDRARPLEVLLLKPNGKAERIVPANKKNLTLDEVLAKLRTTSVQLHPADEDMIITVADYGNEQDAINRRASELIFGKDRDDAHVRGDCLSVPWEMLPAVMRADPEAASFGAEPKPVFEVDDTDGGGLPLGADAEQLLRKES
jgi:hypothetical protein